MRLAPGTPFGHWQVSDIAEARYDVPDQPMRGEMDSFFFLTKDKNYIPHEYPCRTQFAEERRGRRPEVRGDWALTRNWLPFGSPRLDLSGFWFRPTRLAAWARTMVVAETAGTARLRLATCGGAVLFANGQEIGWMADYVRNMEHAVELEVPLEAGKTELVVFLDDLAERDTRFYVQLDWLGGPPARAALPFAADAELVEAVQATLAAMHFERPAYTGGEVAVALPVPLPVDATVEIDVEGDFMSHERLALARSLAAGATRLPLAEAEALPADFRHFRLTVDAGGFVASRVLGVEIAHPQGDPPADRIAEALDAVATRAEPDTVCALARLATGRAGPETEAMIDAALGPIADCWDCADFALVPLIWARMRWGEDLSAALRARIDEAILGYRYWMDEPGNDVQWYFSENHALLFHTAAYLAGHLLPDATFRRSGRSGAEQSAVGRARVRAWLDHFERWEMAEFNSAPYFPIDLKGLTALFALAPDADIRDRAGRGIVRLLEIVANSAHHGVLTAAQGRSYEHTLRAAASLELSAIGRLVWGRGSYGSRFHATPQMALCLRDHGLHPATTSPPAPSATARARPSGASPKGRTTSPTSTTPRPPPGRSAPPPATAGATGAIRRRWSRPASAPSRRPRSGSTTPARRSIRATAAPPTGAAAPRSRGCSSIAASPSWSSMASRRSPTSPTPGSPARSSTRASSTAKPPSRGRAKAL